jgi:hypothetical protein
MVGNWIFVLPDVAVNPMNINFNEDYSAIKMWVKECYSNGSTKRMIYDLIDVSATPFKHKYLQVTHYDVKGNVILSTQNDELANEWSIIVPETKGELIYAAGMVFSRIYMAYEMLLPELKSLT